MKWLVFSKNRPYQLDAFIRSAVENGKIEKSDITVLHKYDDEYIESFEVLSKEHQECCFIAESDFRNQVINWVEKSGPLISFATDDAVFTRSIEKETISLIMQQNSSVLTFSLRLGMHLDYCYPTAQQQPVPNGQVISGIFAWDSSLASGDWGYPLSVDGHVFRSSEILEILKRAEYVNPNTLEAGIQPYKRAVSPLAACFIKSRYMNIPLNTVQKIYNNRSGNVTTEMLELRYQSGKRFDSRIVKEFLNSSAHQEIEFYKSL